jgi:hypothetical protein
MEVPMRHVFPALVSLGAMLFMAISMTAQPTAQESAGVGPFQTPWGDPDLQGIWANDTSTPLERPSAFAGQAVLTDEERAVFTEQRQRQSFGANADRRDAAPETVTDVNRAYNSFWFPVAGQAIARTSLIVDPPDGRVPPLTPQARARYSAWAEAKGLFGSAANPEGSLWNGGRTDSAPEDGTEGGVDGRGSRADHPEDRRLSERCIIWTPLPRLPGGYNNHFRIVQTPEHVAIELEMMHDARIIPLDGRPHPPASIQRWLGDPRGHWEGDTLVVDTTNFTDKAPFKGSFEGLHLIERFTRVDANTINYEVTIEDPTTWTKPWTAAFPLRDLRTLVGGIDQQQVPEMFEYACHEGNYGLTGQLSGARAIERAATAVSR